MLERKSDNKYILDGSEYSADSLLSAVMAKDDNEGVKRELDAEKAAKLDTLFSAYSNVPSFAGLMFMSGSAELFEYIAVSEDKVLLKVVAMAMGYMTDDEMMERIKNSGSESSSYKKWWMEYAEGVLTCDGFDSFRFGSVKRDRNGCYLYDNEKAVLYAEVSRSGDEKRDFLLSITLLGNPEAIDDEEKNREFEWCCYFDDMLSKEDATLLGGALRTIDPYGEKSRLMRRYDVVYHELLPSEAALVTRELVKLMDMYPPEN